MGKAKRKRARGDVVLEARCLEVARAWDGFLAGAVEPAVLVGAYALEEPPRILARTLFRFARPRGAPPSQVGPLVPDRTPMLPYAMETDAEILLLVVAFEEDGGDDLRRVYGTLERAAALTLWRSDDPGSIPSPLSMLAAAPGLRAPTRVRILVDDVDIAHSMAAKDDYVGACAVAQPRARLITEHRFHVADDQGKNDWTAIIKVRTA